MSAVDVKKDKALLEMIRNRLSKGPSNLSYKDKRRFSKIRNAIKKKNNK